MEISKERLKQLEFIEEKMQALEGAGVDNWEGYDIALQEIEEREEIHYKIGEIVEQAVQILQESAFEPIERGAGFASTEEAEIEVTEMLEELVKEIIKQ